jgi:hypothetical protein
MSKDKKPRPPPGYPVAARSALDIPVTKLR